jgi:SAM-dependent methyltransferase
MDPTPAPTTALRDSWIANAAAWTTAVRTQAIASRRLATDAAIVEAVLARRPSRALDVGCGEGWFARALSPHGIAVTGVDGSPPLIEAARAAGPGTFEVMTYDELARDGRRAGTGFDVAIANFALLSENDGRLLWSLRAALAPDGALIIQTVHPVSVGGPYREGWRTEDFRGFGDSTQPWAPMPWYFRTVGSWLALLRDAGYALADLSEPVHPETGAPLSLLMIAKLT